MAAVGSYQVRAASKRPAYAIAGNFHNQFHHWWTGQHAGMAVQLKSMRMVWGRQSEQQAVRQIWDGDDLLVSVPPDMTHFKVHRTIMPW